MRGCCTSGAARSKGVCCLGAGEHAVDAIVINPGGLTHASVAIPFIEVHISNLRLPDPGAARDS